MADIELVIKIPEEVKSRLCFGVTYPKDIQVMCEALNNGTPLSKGHGDLIDSNLLCEQYEKTYGDLYQALDLTPSIIDADEKNENIKTISSASKDEQTTLNDALEKIRTEVEKFEYLNIEDGSDGYDKYIEQYEVLKIIDEYKAESLDARSRKNDDLER